MSERFTRKWRPVGASLLALGVVTVATACGTPAGGDPAGAAASPPAAEAEVASSGADEVQAAEADPMDLYDKDTKTAFVNEMYDLALEVDGEAELDSDKTLEYLDYGHAVCDNADELTAKNPDITLSDVTTSTKIATSTGDPFAEQTRAEHLEDAIVGLAAVNTLCPEHANIPIE